MKYCADTWFLLNAFAKNQKAVELIEDTKRGKTRIIIPLVVFAETIKKLMQKGASQEIIRLFFTGLESSEKIEVAVANKATAAEAAHVSLTYSVPLIDSFVAATCKLTGCDLLLAADTDYQPLVKRKYLNVQSW